MPCALSFKQQTLTRPQLMRKNTIFLVACLVLLTMANTMTAQTTPETAQGPQTVDEQFSDILRTSNNYQEFKVIKKVRLNRLQANIKQRIDGLQQEITSLKGDIEKQQATIENLTASLSDTQNTLEATNKEKDSINFFGSQMSKGSYQTMMWSIAGILLLGLLLFIYKYNSSNSITREARHKLDEVETEFEEYRKKALEKEQKLGRQLQDERNKLVKASKGA